MDVHRCLSSCFLVTDITAFSSPFYRLGVELRNPNYLSCELRRNWEGLCFYAFRGAGRRFRISRFGS